MTIFHKSEKHNAWAVAGEVAQDLFDGKTDKGGNTMCEEPKKKELAKAVRELFEAKFGEFRIDDLIEVLKEFELTAIKRLPPHDQ